MPSTSAPKSTRRSIASHELVVQAYQGYGKGLIKKFKCSPDAFVQMIIQLAYYKMYGKNRPTYESAATRKFQPAVPRPPAPSPMRASPSANGPPGTPPRGGR